MCKRSQISLLKSIFENHFRYSPRRTSPFPFNSLSQISTHPQLGPDLVPSSKHQFSPTSYSIISQKSHFSMPQGSPRSYYSTESGAESGTELDYNREVDMINLKFAEAREEIEMAMESKETVYFNEEVECARDAVKEVLDRFEGLLGKLKESEKEALRRSMGLKIEQLKAELHQLDD
ncbi:embryogenesis-like protein [Mangifera indica]|uniref:embryogenesis-like protein n=1 Tax=Mangifera indica TaxID=29780 RepID=UPI001CFAD012|nr:embryogenesis-like protein [Mangifera indica]